VSTERAAGVAFFTAGRPVLGANVAIGISLARVIRTLTMRCALLDDDSVYLLTILRCNAEAAQDLGLSTADILAVVQRIKPFADLAWVPHRLDLLKKVPRRDGAVVKFVSQDAFGRWRSHA
jgi:hypothetical protein